MHLHKESKSKIQKTSRREAILVQNNLDLKKERSVLREEKRALKRENKRLLDSRDNLRARNKQKSEENKKLKRKISRSGKAKGHQYCTEIVRLCVVLRCLCGCSYRKINLILKVIDVFFGLSLPRIPCANTIQNWVSKSGLYQLRHPDFSSLPKNVCVIADECYRIGKEKVLLVLVCGAQKMQKGALSYSDVSVCFLKAKLSWTSEQIAKALQTWGSKKGFEVKYMVSDEDSRLKSAAQKADVVHFPDISHLLSTCLRRAFEKQESYKKFIKLLSLYRLKSYKSALDWLRPPVLRSKARFMNQDSIVNWGRKMLANMHKLHSSEKEELADLNKELKGCKSILKSLHNCLEVSRKLSKLFKNMGLSAQSIAEANKIMTSFNAKKQEEKLFLDNLQSYLDIYTEKLPDKSCYNVCSDVIESLFGVHKAKIGKGAPSGLSVMGLELPLLCLDINQDTDFQLFLEASKMSDIRVWKKEQRAGSQENRRRKFFKK